MSAEAMGHVFRCSPYRGTSAAHATLLAIADTVSDVHDNQLWMGQTELAKKARLTPRRLSDALQQLVADGWLMQVRDASPRDPAVYELVLSDRVPVWEPRRAREAREAAEAAADTTTGGGDAPSGPDATSGDDAPSGPDATSGGDAEGGPDAPSGQGGRTVRSGVTQRPPNPREPKGTQRSGSATPHLAVAGDGLVTVDVDGTEVQVDPADPDGSFAAWWDAYPRHPATNAKGGGGSRRLAQKRWSKLSTPNRRRALDAIGHYRAHLAAADRPPMYAERFISQQQWDTYDTPPAVGADGLDPLALTVAQVCRLDVDVMAGPARAQLVGAAAALTQAGATPDQLSDVATGWRRDHPDIPVTPAVLVKHLHRYARTAGGRATPNLCGRCKQPKGDRHTPDACRMVAQLIQDAA